MAPEKRRIARDELKESFRKNVVDALLVDSPLAGSDPRIALAAHGWLGFGESVSIEWCVSGTVDRNDVRELMTHMLFESRRYERELARVGRDTSDAYAAFHSSSDRSAGGSTADSATTPSMNAR
jgi:hypothetical protein